MREKLQQIAAIFGNTFPDIGHDEKLAEAFLNVFADDKFRSFVYNRAETDTTTNNKTDVFALYIHAHDILDEALRADNELSEGHRALLEAAIRGPKSKDKKPQTGQGSGGAQKGKKTAGNTAGAGSDESEGVAACFHCGKTERNHSFRTCGKRTDFTPTEVAAGKAAREAAKKPISS